MSGPRGARCSEAAPRRGQVVRVRARRHVHVAGRGPRGGGLAVADEAADLLEQAGGGLREEALRTDRRERGATG